MEPQLKYYSTNKKASPVSFGEALLKGLAPDRGLYMPERFPAFMNEEINSFSSMDYHEIAFTVLDKFLAGEIDPSELRRLTKDAYDFSIPLEHVEHRKYVMRLDQGPTASFKDFAARMMGRLMQYYLEKDKKKLRILVATSGDTGSAIANAFHGLDNIDVVVLFPRSEVSLRQRKQMTTLGKNVKVIGLDGKFDDCQALVKEAFADNDLDGLNLSSANSINIGRLLPQSVYYVYAYAKLTQTGKDEEIIYSVPCGNFGNVMGGMIARTMGVKIKKFVIATNENDEVPTYMETGKYDKIVPSRNCISSAMNVGHPSNLARIIALYGGEMDEKGNIGKTPDLERMKKENFAVSINDKVTRETIKSAHERYGLLLEPHGAVGWEGLDRYLAAYPEENREDRLFVSLETAHPAKFPDHVTEILGIDPEVPQSLKGLEEKKEEFTDLSSDYRTFKQYLQDNFRA